MTDPDQFLKKAKDSIVISFINPETKEPITADDLYIVWFAKVLGNWKALVSTDKWSGMYWEVTYNGNKQETYVDSYFKGNNAVISDDPSA